MNKSDLKALISRTSGRQLGRELSTAIVRFPEAVASRLGRSATEWRYWDLLDQHGPCSAGRLAELSGFTPGAITGIVDRGASRATPAARAIPAIAVASSSIGCACSDWVASSGPSSLP